MKAAETRKVSVFIDLLKSKGKVNSSYFIEETSPKYFDRDTTLF